MRSLAQAKYDLNAIIEFLAPLIIFGLSFYLFPWYVTLLLYLLILFSTRADFLLSVYTALTFYNVMLLEQIPFWASLITSFGGLLIILVRFSVIKSSFPRLLLIPMMLIVLFTLSFIFRSRGEYFFLTGLKSSLQLIFLLSVIIVFTLLPDRIIAYSKKQFDRNIAVFIVFYLVTALLFHDYSDRFGAATGPQCLALQMSLLLCYCCSDNDDNRPFQFLLLLGVFLTGSRTYFIIASMILVYDYVRRSSLKVKLIVLVNAFLLACLLLFLLPLTNSRFDYTSGTFWGTLMGRVKFYQSGWELFLKHPFLGNGMGSMLIVLETWGHRPGYELYKSRGDTTIVHNEYLRILIETGLLGLSLIIYGVTRLWQHIRTPAAKYMLLVFLLGSLVENTLSLYTTGALLLLILMFFSIKADKYTLMN
ncbi:MAG TPA: O-antigen ligase family protein [Chitinophagaceae bacterium]|nr:O-antigen ligase family protein [Chitinophagaceae bacterium]